MTLSVAVVRERRAFLFTDTSSANRAAVTSMIAARTKYVKRRPATMGIDFSPSALMAMMVFGLAGFVFFKRGKKSGSVSHMVYGVLLLIYPYFVIEFLPILLIGLALLAMAYFVRFG